jgi:hypothetical protein
MIIKIDNSQTTEKSFLEKVIEGHGTTKKKTADVKQDVTEHLGNIMLPEDRNNDRKTR